VNEDSLSERHCATPGEEEEGGRGGRRRRRGGRRNVM